LLSRRESLRGTLEQIEGKLMAGKRLRDIGA
jgi:hypothetical protein